MVGWQQMRCNLIIQVVCCLDSYQPTKYKYLKQIEILGSNFLTKNTSSPPQFNKGKMVSITASTPTSTFARTGLSHKAFVARPAAIIGLPTMGKVGKVRCSMEGRPIKEEKTSTMGVGASSLMMAATAAAMSSPAAMALVDERMSGEGTGLPFGLSNNLLGWILLGVFALIWALYFTYTATLDEDEESGLSL